MYTDRGHTFISTGEDADGYGVSLQFLAKLSSGYANPDTKKFPDARRAKTVVNLLLRKRCTQYYTPEMIFYPDSYSASTWCQICTNNKISAGYVTALFEYLAYYFMMPADENGYYPHGEISRFIVGNEIDFDDSWNAIVPAGAAKLSMEDYIEEHERALRIANNAFKKFHADMMVCTSFTHHFESTVSIYSPKDIITYMCAKSLREGNYDWGMSWHPYGANLGEPNFLDSDFYSYKLAGDFSTSRVTWTNFEVLEMFLKQESKLCNGKVRKIFITEGGVTSGNPNLDASKVTKARQIQAAGIAYAYQKICHLDCIETMCYYRYHDIPAASEYSGLLDGNDEEKLAYHLDKWVDTQYSDIVCQDYLKYISWRNPYTRVSYSAELGNVSSWVETMNIVGGKFDYFSIWDYDNRIATRIVQETYS